MENMEVNTGQVEFDVGDIVVITPSKESLKFIELNPHYNKFVGEKAKIISLRKSGSGYVAYIEYLNPELTKNHAWEVKDLTLYRKACRIGKTEVSGEV